MTPTKTHRPQDPLVATKTHHQPPEGSQATLEATREEMPPGVTVGAKPPGGNSMASLGLWGLAHICYDMQEQFSQSILLEMSQ